MREGSIRAVYFISDCRRHSKETWRPQLYHSHHRGTSIVLEPTHRHRHNHHHQPPCISRQQHGDSGEKYCAYPPSSRRIVADSFTTAHKTYDALKTCILHNQPTHNTRQLWRETPGQSRTGGPEEVGSESGLGSLLGHSPISERLSLPVFFPMSGQAIFIFPLSVFSCRPSFHLITGRQVSSRSPHQRAVFSHGGPDADRLADGHCRQRIAAFGVVVSSSSFFLSRWGGEGGARKC